MSGGAFAIWRSAGVSVSRKFSVPFIVTIAYVVWLSFETSGGKLVEWSKHEGNLLYTIKRGLGNPSFYYTLAYCTAVTVFGIRRIKRRRTPYVKWQTISLAGFQILPLFLIPYFILPMDLIPDFIPGLGFTDDMTVLITAVSLIGSHMRPEHRDKARAALARLRQGWQPA